VAAFIALARGELTLKSFNNCLQFLSCIISIAACITGSDELVDAADIIRTIANIVWHIVSGCMVRDELS
jgi:hypothetical protein